MEKLVRVTSNNQVAIPVAICKQLRIRRGCYLEAKTHGYHVVLTPVRLVDEENYRTYERVIREGRYQVKRGDVVSWDKVKAGLGRLTQSKSKR